MSGDRRKNYVDDDELGGCYFHSSEKARTQRLKSQAASGKKKVTNYSTVTLGALLKARGAFSPKSNKNTESRQTLKSSIRKRMPEASSFSLLTIAL